jgi:sodium/pantothenate symporter
MVSPVVAAAGSNNAALWTFIVYTVGVFVLAAFANRLLTQKNFLSEYFLGSRGLGVWAFALTFAATSSSGGSFTGFPAKIYTHGWILALWIGSYMVVPICTMGLIGKRVNQVARISGSITMPDVIRDRFNSRTLGLLSTLLIVFFLVFNLVAQFKAGSVILNILLQDVGPFDSATHWLDGALPSWSMFLDADGNRIDAAYLLCLVVFGLSVIIYTSYGGFHAVVWTDVMQGIVMVFGVVVMLPLALNQVGGLEHATRTLAEMKPARAVELTAEAAPNIKKLPAGTVFAWDDPVTGASRLFRIPKDTILADYAADDDETTFHIPALEHQEPDEIAELTPAAGAAPDIRISAADVTQEFSYVTGPGPNPEDVNGFLPLGVAISFFFMWAISGSGQPQYMVRLMAFKNSQTLRRGIMTVTVYYSMIYFPLVVIFVCARVLIPEIDSADSIMPRMAVLLTEHAGAAWLGGLLIAAPFAAVMSTVDSFLLVISSAVVRDVYQRNINPDASERTIKWMSYFTTLLVGVIALLGAVNPPEFLQDIIVYVGSGLAACFLFPVVAALYWPRMNTWGMLAGMLGGFAAHLSMHVLGIGVNGSFVKAYRLFGMDPVVIGLFASLACVLLVTPLTPRPSEALVRQYFNRAGR